MKRYLNSVIRFITIGVAVMMLSGMVSARQPILDGAFWQLGSWLFKDWSDQKFADEVKAMKEAGMDIIIIHHGAWWDNDKRDYQTFLKSSVFREDSLLENRDPMESILQAADKYGMKVILGDFLAPDCWQENPSQWMKVWTTGKSEQFRKEYITRYSKHPSFYGVYITNEPSPTDVDKTNTRELWINSTRTVAQTIKRYNPNLKVIHSVGLYAEWQKNKEGKLVPMPPSRQYLDKFWRPWITGIAEIDTWMVIDGVGTYLSDIKHTDMAQAWCQDVAKSAKKEYWTDVENAVMGNIGYFPFTMDQLEDSLQVAARHADKIVTFEYIHYMAKSSPKPEARKLYTDYQKYRKQYFSNPR